MLGSRSIISLIDLLACALGGVTILAVAFMANRDAASPGAYPGRSFVLRVSSEDPHALLALLVVPPGQTTATELRGELRGSVRSAGAEFPFGPCVLAGWSLTGEERMAPPGFAGRAYTAAFPAPQEGEWQLGVRFFSRAGGAPDWPSGTPLTTRLVTMEVIGVQGEPCNAVRDTSLAMGEVAACSPFRVERAD